MEDSKEEGETLAVDWVLAFVSERAETPIIDSGAVCSTCPPGFAPLAALEDVAGERPLRAANGHNLENFGSKVVQQEVKLASGKPTQVLTKYRAANVQRPIISLSEAVNGGNVGLFSKDFSGIARAGDTEIVVKGDYIPLMQKGGLFEMGLLGATQGDARKWAKSRGTELGVATVIDGGSVEVGNTIDKRLETACMKSVKEMEAEKEVSKKSSTAKQWSRQRERWQRHQARQQTRRSPGTMRRIFRTVRGARCACKERPGKAGTRSGQSK